MRNGHCAKSVSLSRLRKLLLPLPPLAEQKRIVAKVDELMALCDQVEASLTDTAATRRRLLDALLAEAPEPAEAGSRGGVMPRCRLTACNARVFRLH